MSVEVIATAKVYLSEDINKVIEAIKNVIPNASIKAEEYNVIGIANGKEALMEIHRQTKAKEILGILRKRLLNNLLDNHTWFYLNKQAAYAKVVVICEEAEESPLGPIKVEIKSNDIDSIIEWLTRF